MTALAFKTGLRRLSVDQRVGVVRQITDSQIIAQGPLCTVGEVCELHCDRAPSTGALNLAEVVAVGDEEVILAALDSKLRVFPGARVIVREVGAQAPVGPAFAGRAINALGEPIDARPAPIPEAFSALAGQPVEPLQRMDPRQPVVTGIRAIDTMLTLGAGQRIGIFAAAGVGKTTLMRQLARQMDCDRLILCLVGERGREVAGHWQELQDSPIAAKATLVAATSEASPVLRARAVQQALCLAEDARARGEHVVLVLDSITRYAMALREIGLTAGEPPTLRAYTPNVFSALSQVVERCGAVRSGGAITAIMTVLAETDDADDPIAETMKSLLDGHIVLSRAIAERGQFPAIDIPASISRLAVDICTPDQLHAARQVLRELALYEESRTMIDTGLYKTGANPALDRAIQNRPRVLAFLQQDQSEAVSFEDSLSQLSRLSAAGGSFG